MKRTFNFTGRKSINRSDVAIIVREASGSYELSVEPRLAKYSFPSTAEIWVEAYRNPIWMQFQWGSIAAPIPPANKRLQEFESIENVKFRLSVVQPEGGEHHKVLGVADNLSCFKPGDNTEERNELLVVYAEELDGLIWKLDMDGEAPALIINKNVEPTWRELASSNTFRALVYPEILRRLLSHIAENNDPNELSEDSDDSWEAKWVRFAMYLGVPWPLSTSAEEAKEEWVEEAVRAFCRRNDFLKTLCESTNNEI